MRVLGITLSNGKYIDNFKNLGQIHYESEFLKEIVISTKLNINEVLSMQGVKK